jgi:hypothetical protein
MNTLPKSQVILEIISYFVFLYSQRNNSQPLSGIIPISEILSGINVGHSSWVILKIPDSTVVVRRRQFCGDERISLACYEGAHFPTRFFPVKRRYIRTPFLSPLIFDISLLCVSLGYLVRYEMFLALFFVFKLYETFWRMLWQL